MPDSHRIAPSAPQELLSAEWRARARRLARRLRWGWAWAAAIPWLCGLLLLASGFVLGLRRLGYSAAPVLAGTLFGALGILGASAWRGRRVALADVWVRLDRGLGLDGALVAALDGRGAPPLPAARLRYPWRPRRFLALGLAVLSFAACWLVPRTELAAPRAYAAGAPLSWKRSQQLVDEVGDGSAHGLRPELVRQWRRALEELEASTPAGERFSPASLEAGDALNRKMASDLRKSRAALEQAAASLRPSAGGSGAETGSLRAGQRTATESQPRSSSLGSQARAGQAGPGGAAGRRGQAGQRGSQPGQRGVGGGAGLEALPEHLKSQLRAARQPGAGAGQAQALGQQLDQMSSTLQQWESQLRPARGQPGQPGQGRPGGAGEGQGQGAGPGRGGSSTVLVLRQDPSAALPATPQAAKERPEDGQLGDRIREHRYKAEVNEGQLAPQGGGASAGSTGGQWVWPEQQLSVEERRRLRALQP